MSQRCKKYANFDTFHSGETLFQYLKRKKQVSLQSSLRKPKAGYKGVQSPNLSMIECEWTSKSKAGKLDHSTISPRVVSGATSRKDTLGERSERKTARNFIEMVSPIKKPAQSQGNRSMIDFGGKTASTHANKSSEMFSRRLLNKTAESIKLALTKYDSLIEALKQSSQTLSFQISPLINFCQQNGDGCMVKRVKEVRIKLKNFHRQFEQLNAQNPDKLMEEFNQKLIEHLQAIESNLKEQKERDTQNFISTNLDSKKNIIFELEEQKKHLNNQIDIYSKRLDKAQQAFDSLKRQAQEAKEDKLQQEANLKLKHSEIVFALREKIQQLTVNKQSLQKKVALLTAQLKDLNAKIQATQAKSHQLVADTLKGREEYLLNQIVANKSQFGNDLQAMQQLFLQKENRLFATIGNLQQQVEQEQVQKQQLEAMIESTRKEEQALRIQVKDRRLRNQCLLSDLLRMNEELYQHWLALKDIKILTVRLGSFPDIATIYQDLSFNQRLFN